MRVGYGVDVSVGPPEAGVPAGRVAADVIDAMIAEAIAAEQAGFHSVRCPDRHGRTDVYLPGPLQLLTIIARETERVALGAFALANPLYDPIMVAEQCAVIDTISRGRLFMAWARGKKAYGMFGIFEERRLGRYLEHLAVIEQAYRGERFSFDGEFYKIKDALVSPQPYQRPRFPYWGAGMAGPAIERSARLAQAWACDDFPFEVDTWREQVRAYRDAAVRHDKVPFVVLMRNGWVADSYADAMQQYGHHYLRHLRAAAAAGRMKYLPDLDHPNKITPESIRPHLVMGSAAECIEKIEYYREELGVDYVTLRLRLPEGPSFERVHEQIHRFGAEVASVIHRNHPQPMLHPAIPIGARW
jgi:alkanesulfonate monooxygenase SsuD/methylene tetrahydromethanopterin reductase-like flavin-dependent oxidoreductase (luciferase family)